MRRKLICVPKMKPIERVEDAPLTGLGAVLVANRSLLIRFARVRGISDPEDIVHELWLKTREARAGPVSDPLAYLMRSTNNLIIDRQRSEAQRAQREAKWAEGRVDNGSQSSETASPERLLLGRAELQQVDESLRALGQRTRLIFYRYRVDGLTRSQVAAEMELSLSAVEKHLAKAYRALLAHSRSSDDHA